MQNTKYVLEMSEGIETGRIAYEYIVGAFGEELNKDTQISFAKRARKILRDK